MTFHGDILGDIESLTCGTHVYPSSSSHLLTILSAPLRPSPAALSAPSPGDDSRCRRSIHGAGARFAVPEVDSRPVELKKLQLLPPRLLHPHPPLSTARATGCASGHGSSSFLEQSEQQQPRREERNRRAGEAAPAGEEPPAGEAVPAQRGRAGRGGCAGGEGRAGGVQKQGRAERWR